MPRIRELPGARAVAALRVVQAGGLAPTVQWVNPDTGRPLRRETAAMLCRTTLSPLVSPSVERARDAARLRLVFGRDEEALAFDVAIRS